MQSYWEFFDKLEKESTLSLQSGEYSVEDLSDELRKTEDDPVLMEKYQELLEQKKSECMKRHGLYAYFALLMYEAVLILKSNWTSKAEKNSATGQLHKLFTYCYFNEDLLLTCMA